MKKEANSGRIALSSDSSTLLEALRAKGYHLRADCGGEGICGRCQVRFLSAPPSPDETEVSCFTAAEIASGWRLACRHSDSAELEYNPEWELRFAVETVQALNVGVEVGLAVDIGTTGLVAALVDLDCGKPLIIARGYNPQRAWGADVMTRLVAARDPATLEMLQQAVLKAIHDALTILQAEPPPLLVGAQTPPLSRGDKGDLLSLHPKNTLAVGNTAMIHLAAGIPETTLSVFPFHSPLEGLSGIPVLWNDLKLNLAGPLQGFVGSDLLAVLRYLNLHEITKKPSLVMDFGTNSEIALWDGEEYWVTSCAAGPAFEGGGITCGSAAGPDIAVEVVLKEGDWLLLPDDDQPKNGLCGSALIALLAELLRHGQIASSGKLLVGRIVPLQDHPNLALTQKDVRSLQLAKGAIHTGIKILARRAGLNLDQIADVVVTGAFARSLKCADLKEIGLVPGLATDLTFLNDGALYGAALAITDSGEPFAALRLLIRVINLVDEPDFQELFLEGLELKPMV